MWSIFTGPNTNWKNVCYFQSFEILDRKLPVYSFFNFKIYVEQYHYTAVHRVWLIDVQNRTRTCSNVKIKHRRLKKMVLNYINKEILLPETIILVITSVRPSNSYNNYNTIWKAYLWRYSQIIPVTQNRAMAIWNHLRYIR